MSVLNFSHQIAWLRSNGASIHRSQQALTDVCNRSPAVWRPELALDLRSSESRLHDPFDLSDSLLVRVNSIIFPEVFAHELRVGVQAAPIVLVAGENAVDVLFVLFCLALVLLVAFVRLALCDKVSDCVLNWQSGVRVFTLIISASRSEEVTRHAADSHLWRLLLCSHGRSRPFHLRQFRLDRLADLCLLDLGPERLASRSIIFRAGPCLWESNGACGRVLHCVVHIVD